MGLYALPITKETLKINIRNSLYSHIRIHYLGVVIHGLTVNQIFARAALCSYDGVDIHNFNLGYLFLHDKILNILCYDTKTSTAV